MYPWLSQGFILVYTISSVIKLNNVLNITGTALYQILDFNSTHFVYLIKLNLNTTYGPLHLAEEKVVPLNETFSIPFINNETLKFLKSHGLECSNSTCTTELINETEDMVTYYRIVIDINKMIVKELEEKTLLFRGGKVVGESRTLLRLSR